MLGGSRLRATVAVLTALTGGLALAGTAAASSDGVVIEAQDACDEASFKAVGIDCDRVDGSGKTVTFDQLIADVQKDHAVGSWRFRSDDVTVEAGEPVSVVLGRGGEFHTFTKVQKFGPGCIDVLNALIFGTPDPAPECASNPFARDAIPVDGEHVHEVPATELTRGTNLFQCMIHPWMHAKVTVE